MNECIFCNIIAKKMEAQYVYEDDRIVVFADIAPQAPYHWLIVPRKHIATINDLQSDDNELIGHMVQVAAKLAQDYNFAEKGYRVLFNCNSDGGQVVYHIHLHVLAGRKLNWPPG